MIDINLPVLEKDHDWKTHRVKLVEESNELFFAIRDLEQGEIPEGEAVENLISETLDVLQMCVGVLDKVLENHPRALNEGMKAHIEKLYGRGWKFKKWIQIEED